MTLLRHPYSGLFYTNEHIERYAALEEDAMSREEAVYELVNDGGFEVVRVKPDQSSFLSSLIEAVVRIADNTGRAASGLEAITKLAPLLTPPLGVEQVAGLARVAVKTVYRWKADGLLKPLADNKPLLFDQAEVHDFIRSRRRRGK